KYPIRVELFDDEVDSIRYFNAVTQRSLEQINEVTIHPAEELLLTQNEFLSAVQKLESLLNETIKSLKKNTAKEKLLESISYDIERFKSGEKLTGMSIYNAYVYDEPDNLLDYLAEDAVVFFDEMSRVQEAAEQLDNEEAEWYEHSLEMNYLMDNMTFSYDVTKI